MYQQELMSKSRLCWPSGVFGRFVSMCSFDSAAALRKCIQYAGSGLGSPRNLADEQSALIGPLLPALSGLGRPAKWTYRQIVNGLFYVLRVGLTWWMLPRETFPPMTTVQHYFYVWRAKSS